MSEKGVTDACQGDSGGPYVCQTGKSWTIYGATSWGRGCADPNYPGVWARIHHVRDWILQTTDNLSPPTPPPPPTPAPPPQAWTLAGEGCQESAESGEHFACVNSLG